MEPDAASPNPWMAMDENSAVPTWKKLSLLLAVGLGLLGFWLTSRVSYLLFHSLAEAFSILVAGGIFTVAWNTRRYIPHGFFLFLGVGILGVSVIDFLHLLAYKGMGVFPRSTADLATQLWVAARYLQAGTMLLAPLFLTRKARGAWLLSVYGLATAGLLAAVFGGWFPACFIEGPGLTPFKIASEYLICGLIAGGMILIYGRRRYLDPRVGRLVISALGLSIATELAFTLYSDVYGLFNQIGHVLKIASFSLLYHGVTVSGLRRPYQTLFLGLTESEDRYRMLFATMTEGFALHEVITDESGHPCDYRFLEVNPAFERLTGLQQGDLIGRRVLEVLPDTEPYWIETYGRVALTGESTRLENYSAELARWYEVLAYCPGPGRFAVIFTDITWRKQIEEALRASEEQFRSMFERHQAAMLLVEPKSGAIVDANPAAVLFYGYSLEELRRIQITDMNQLPPDEVRDECRRAKAEERNYFIFQHKLADGRVRWVEVYSTPFETAQGPMLFSIIHDITERREAEEMLRTSRLAALNLMEDAQEARQKAEKISAELEQSAHRLQQAHDELEIRVQERTTILNKAVEALQLEISQREELEETLRTSEKQVRFFAAQCLTAQEQERRRIAGELHDGLASTLVAVKYRIEKVSRQITPGAGPPELFPELAAMIGRTIQEVRRIMADLRPAVLDDLGILPALNWLFREFEKTYSHIRVEQQSEVSEHEVAGALKTPIFRLTQESLNNIAKHSEATLVTFNLAIVDDRIVLIIRDNGRGFDPEVVVKGLGLTTMKERTELSGGEYRLESAPGKGTSLFASWPLAD